MLKVLEQMKNEVEEQIGSGLTGGEVAWLEQIKTVEDLAKSSPGGNFDADLIFDAAVALGMTEDAAEALAYPVGLVEKITVYPKPTDQELEQEYGQLRRGYSAAMSCLADAEYHLIEEISAEGFASAKTRQTKEYYLAEAETALATLSTFKANNAEFVTRSAKAKSEANHRAMWNS